MKQTITIIALTIASFAVRAQSSSAGGSQHMQMSMAEVVGAGFGSPSGGSGGGASATVDIPMTGTNTMASGVESSDIQVQLQGTTNFDISVQSSSTNFTYTGSATSQNVMQVSDVLAIEVTSNNTGGSVANGFGSYQSINGASKKMISAGQAGVRTFSFKYKATPGFNYAAGTYTTSIVYTISKI
ncbi:MAG: hypothetical protein JST82_15790 [Bacteroidetes bacterium]|nr:hypothetical protein [Bacteroidota bacterium]